ncbi:MAG: NAD(P)/FAD-dependent oxidoreductase [Thermoanaerobaculia bacterium]
MNASTPQTDFDVLIVGGGPAGATAALQLARRGRRVALFEKERFPRFHVGESLLPKSQIQLEALGLDERIRALPRVKKLGAEFLMGDGSVGNDYWFHTSLVHGDRHETFNIERAVFDSALLESAVEAGADVRQGTRVETVETLRDGEVALSAGGTTYTGRYLLDASGLLTHLGKHLKLRRVHPRLRNIAYYGHFRNVERRSGDPGGFATIVMCDEGWFWLIPINEAVTSIGMVLEERHARRAGVPAKEMLFWGIRNCPVVAQRCRDAIFPETTYVTGDYSHSCRPYAGPGYFLIGDAATFIDPIFSTGVTLGLMSADKAVSLLDEMLGGDLAPPRARRRYARFVRGSTRPYFRVVEAYYGHEFRELFLHGQGPLDIHRAVISLLAGHVFPRPDFAVRWRMALFHLFVKLQGLGVPVVDRKGRFSLLRAAQIAG